MGGGVWGGLCVELRLSAARCMLQFRVTVNASIIILPLHISLIKQIVLFSSLFK